MIPPSTAPDFLEKNGWAGAQILPLAGDASFRRYFRVLDGDRQAVLMDAPPEHEDTAPFIRIADHLSGHGFRAPRIMARDENHGLLLLEDFGDRRVGPVLAENDADEREIYRHAIDTLVRIHAAPCPAIEPYDEPALLREVRLLTEWYAPAVGLMVDSSGFDAAWRAVWRGLLERTAAAPVLVLRDYHADNLMLLDDGGLGLLDFQDALAGHRAYDLVSLLKDARRDVSPGLEQEMIERYIRDAGISDREQFLADYHVLGAQRNSKILGIFTRLWKRDSKPHYLPLQPRVWAHLEDSLRHPALAPVCAWFDANLPMEMRADAWREHLA